MNKTILLGRLTKAPEIRMIQTNNTKVANFNLAVNRRFVKQGEERQADFISIVAFGKQAEFAEKYLKQGLQIALCGRIQTRNWEDDNGQKHYITEVVAEELYFADAPKKLDEGILYSNKSNKTDNAEASEVTAEDSIIDDDDLPF